jgi:hypothetical protein
MKIFDATNKAFDKIFGNKNKSNPKTIISKTPKAGPSIFDKMPTMTKAISGTIPYIGTGRNKMGKVNVRKTKKAQRRRAYLASLKG